MARQTASFTIRACDAGGANVACGGDPFVVAVRGPSRVHARVTDNSDGTYLCDYKAAVSGAYSVVITLHGVPLAGSPFQLTMKRPRRTPTMRE